MESPTHLSDEESLVYNIIKQETRSSGGILQSKLRERAELRDIQPRKLSTIVNKLTRARLVRRVAVDGNGQPSYLLQAVEQRDQVEGERVPNQEVLLIPCHGCRNLYMCGEGRSYSPLKCPYLTRFLMDRAHPLGP
ncbi:MAG: hypothetical protein N3D82_03400 [Ignisphaera sp.]|nr:hypothetical protein [Ignisphaera sp.]MCX8168055.1 hypothetical protein [Ignisphaera sp.]MDW8085756.1 hypothetical protein [Ignisphaera sp.]